MSVVTAPVTGLLELHADIDPSGTSEANIPIRWCATPELTQLIAEHNIANPYLMIVVRPYSIREEGRQKVKNYGAETKRYFVPLTDEMAFVSFSRPGNNSVFATVVWNEEGDGSFTLKRAFNDSSNHWVDSLFDMDGGLNNRRHFSMTTKAKTYRGNLLFEAQDEITVVVPEEMFAKEPPQWAKEYVGKFVRAKAFDQCGFRRRFIPAILFAPFYFVLAYSLRVVELAVSLVFGLRGIQLRGFIHPIQYSVIDVFEEADDPIWWYDKHASKLPVWRWPLNPITPVALALVIFGISTFNITRGSGEMEYVDDVLGWGWWACLGLSLLIHALPYLLFGVLLAVGVLAGLVSGVPVFDKAKAWSGLRKQAAKERERAELRERSKAMQEALDRMICSGGSSRVSVDALPKKKQTFALRFAATKHKVCKPFAR